MRDIEKQRAAKRRHYARNKERYKANALRWKQSLRREVDRLKDIPCADCGGRFPPECMDFDHLPEFEKSAEIGDLLKNGRINDLKVELQKCEVVCANCHRIRTRTRRALLV